MSWIPEWFALGTLIPTVSFKWTTLSPLLCGIHNRWVFRGCKKYEHSGKWPEMKVTEWLDVSEFSVNWWPVLAHNPRFTVDNKVGISFIWSFCFRQRPPLQCHASPEPLYPQKHIEWVTDGPTTTLCGVSFAMQMTVWRTHSLGNKWKFIWKVAIFSTYIFLPFFRLLRTVFIWRVLKYFFRPNKWSRDIKGSSFCNPLVPCIYLYEWHFSVKRAAWMRPI